MMFSFRVPVDNERGPTYVEQALNAIHQSNTDRLPISLGIGRHDDHIILSIAPPPDLQNTVKNQLFAQYPESQIDELPDIACDRAECGMVQTLFLRVTPDLYPIRRYVQFEDSLNRSLADPLAGVLEACSDADLHARIEFTIVPTRGRWRSRAQQCLRRLDTPFFSRSPALAHLYASLALSRFPMLRVLGWVLAHCARGNRLSRHTDMLATSASRGHDREQDLQAASDKVERLLFDVQLRVVVAAPDGQEQHVSDKLRDVAGAFGTFAGRQARFRPCRRPRWFLLSAEELATLWHPRTNAASAAHIAAVDCAHFPVPADLPVAADVADAAVLGTALYRNHVQPFAVPLADRRLHTSIFGKSGMGKSTLLQQCIRSDIDAGRGVCLIDPHGDLAESLLAYIPKNRTNDVIYFDAADTDNPIAFNVLDCASSNQASLVVANVVAAFKKLHGNSWGPRTEYYLRNAVAALIELPSASLVSLHHFLSDPTYRTTVANHIRDPYVRNVWLTEFAKKPSAFQEEALAAIQNKVGQFVTSPLLRHIIGQVESRLDLRSIMDEGRILLVNLSKGRIGDDASNLLGSFLVTAIQLATMGRADIAEDQRRDFFLYVDEFQNYATESFATILSEARKYRLALTVANQYLDQLDSQTLAALFGNVQTLIAFQVGVQDADIIADQFGGMLTKENVLGLPRFHAYTRLSLHGKPRPPFLMQTAAPDASQADADRAAIVRRTSRQRYTRQLTEVEQQLRLPVFV